MVMNMIHDQHVHHKWHVFVILFFLCPIQSLMVISNVGSFPVQSGCSLTTFPAFRCMKLALTNDTSYIFEFLLGVVGRHVGVVRHLGMSGCLSVYWEHLYAPCTSPMSPHTSRGHWGGICTSVRYFCVSTSVCPSVHPLLVSNSITVGLSCWLINFIVGHLQSHVCLALVPMCNIVIILHSINTELTA